MISRTSAALLIGFLLLCCPLHVLAVDSKGGFSPDVAAFMETDGMTVFTDPEIMAIQTEMAEYAEKEDLTDEERKKSISFIDNLMASIERVAREYMSGKRVANNPEHTVQDKRELPSCVDDGSCDSKKQDKRSVQVVEPLPPELPQRTYQKTPEQPPAEEKNTSFGEMLNNTKPGSLEDIQSSLKL